MTATQLSADAPPGPSKPTALWVVTATDTTPQQAQEATGIDGWSQLGTAVTWTTPDDRLAAGAVAALRRASRAATRRRASRPDVEQAVAALAQIGHARAELRRIKDHLDEAELIRTLSATGFAQARIGELAGLSRVRVGQILGETVPPAAEVSAEES